MPHILINVCWCNIENTKHPTWPLPCDIWGSQRDKPVRWMGAFLTFQSVAAIEETYKSGSRPIHLAAPHWLSDKLANSINKFCWVPVSTHWQESIIDSTRQFLYSEEMTGSVNMLACQITVLFLFELLTFRILMPKYGKTRLKILWGNVFFFY